MKKRNNIRFAIIFCAFLEGCHMAGGVSRKSSAEWLSHFVDVNLAEAVCNDGDAPEGFLVSIYDKWYVNDDIRYLIISHRNFPVEKRLKMIENGKVPDIYMPNAIRTGRITNSEMTAYFNSINNGKHYSSDALFTILSLTGKDESLYRTTWTIYKEKRMVLPFWGRMFPCSRFIKNEGVRGCMFELETLRENKSLPLDIQGEIINLLKTVQ